MNQVAGPQALSFVVVLPGLILLTLGTAFADTQNLDDYNEAWIVVAVQAFVVALIVFSIFGLLARFLRGQIRVAAVFTLYAVTETSRMLVVESQALNRGLIQEADWPAQLLTAALTGPTIYGVAALAINQTFEFRSTVADLTARTVLLQTTLARTEIDANIARHEILKTAKDSIRHALKISMGVSGSVVPTAATIRSLLDVSDDVVRPLSHKLMYIQGKFSGIAPEPVRTKLHFWEVIDLATTTHPFRPAATVLVGGMLAIGAAVTQAPYGLGVAALVILLLASYALIAVARRFLSGPLRRLRLPARFVVLEAIYIALCFPASLAVGLLNRLPEGLMVPFLLYATGIGSLVLWYLATMSGVRKGFAAVIGQVREVNRQLEWAVARVNARLWTDQKELSRILHNEVQGVLVSTAFKMQRDLDAGKDVSIDPIAVRQAVLNSLNSPTAQSTPTLERALAVEQERWSGVLDISLDIDAGTFDIVNQDRDARRVIIDLVHEFMVNAVKHGKARSAQMWMRPTSRGTMDISLYNDGLPMPADRKPGLGAELAFSVSVSLRLPPHLSGVELRIEIPCDGTDTYVGASSAPVFATSTHR